MQATTQGSWQDTTDAVRLDDVVLYSMADCYYCQKVLDYLAIAGIELEVRDIAYPENAEAVVVAGGRMQVPCLIIDGVALYESDDIIDYLESRM